MTTRRCIGPRRGCWVRRGLGAACFRVPFFRSFFLSLHASRVVSFVSLARSFVCRSAHLCQSLRSSLDIRPSIHPSIRPSHPHPNRPSSPSTPSPPSPPSPVGRSYRPRRRRRVHLRPCVPGGDSAPPKTRGARRSWHGREWARHPGQPVLPDLSAGPSGLRLPLLRLAISLRLPQSFPPSLSIASANTPDHSPKHTQTRTSTHAHFLTASLPPTAPAPAPPSMGPAPSLAVSSAVSPPWS